jgi:hypothetical protein
MKRDTQHHNIQHNGRVVMLSVLMLSFTMLNVENNPFILGVMLSIVLLNVIMLTVMAQILDLPENNFRTNALAYFGAA